MKKVAILQSNYIPWKGYFDMIAAVDEFIIYDDVQFTKNDWRNRNKIKTQNGLQWLSVPTGTNINRKIRDVEIKDKYWKIKHWTSICHNYKRSPHFDEIASKLESIYSENEYCNLSDLNRTLIELVCKYLGINTKISNAWDYEYSPGKSDGLISLCKQAGAVEYVSGPSAKSYINEELFAKEGVQVKWFDYENYPEYPQLWGKFIHEVTILDLLFNCGTESAKYMRHVKR